jgi:hypothetical protein
MVLKGSVNFGPRGSTALGFGGHAHRAFPITDTIQEMMRVYYKKYPEAKEFVEKFCERGMPDRA